MIYIGLKQRKKHSGIRRNELANVFTKRTSLLKIFSIREVLKTNKNVLKETSCLLAYKWVKLYY